MASPLHWKHAILGRPIATKHAHQERLNNATGLAVFASDALSSVAYATEEVLKILVIAASMAVYNLVWQISIALVLLLGIVALSYYQTIHEYPEGGGSYSVTKDNLHPSFSWIAAGALLIDYILTVSVSVASGIAAIISAFPKLQPYVVPISCLAIAFIAFVNLRGTKESGAIFSIPTYGFIISVLVVSAWGIIHGINEPQHIPDLVPYGKPRAMAEFGSPSLAPAFIFFIARAFAASCTAMTGVEAVSNGVQAFRRPEAKNASRTLTYMAGTLGVMFLGVSWCAQHYGAVPMDQDKHGYMTVLAQIADKVAGNTVPIFGHSIVFWIMQFFTAMILILAANTAYADFPRLSSLLARDSLLPRGLSNLGDRLVFNNGIFVLTIVAMALVVGFKADVSALIPLYAVGVFTAFTLSQTGMVYHWIKKGKRGWGMIMNATGALTTGVVTAILTVTKWREGAWVTVFAVAGMVIIFAMVRRHYAYLKKELELEPNDQITPVKSVVLMLVPQVHKGILRSIAYAQSLSHDVRAIHVTLSQEGAQNVKRQWVKFGEDIPLVILESPYRSLVAPILDYIDDMTAEDPNLMVTVIVPQAVPKYPWHAILHNNAALLFKRALGGRKNVVITNVRYFLK